MPQPDKYSIIAVANSIQDLEEVGTRVVNNDKYTLERLEDFLNDAVTFSPQLASSVAGISDRIFAQLADFDEAFYGTGKMIQDTSGGGNTEQELHGLGSELNPCLEMVPDSQSLNSDLSSM